MSNGLKKIIAVVIGFAIVGIGYYYLTSSSQPPPSDQGTEVISDGGQNQIGVELITTLQTIRSINLDRSVLDGALFLSLHDFSTKIVPQPVGRDNPFAPVYGAAAPKGTTKK